MSFSFDSAKALLRQQVHETFGVEGLYKDASLSFFEPVRVRYHPKKIDRYGDIVETGYADVVEVIERIVFYPALTPEFQFQRDGRVTLASMPGVEFILRLLEPSTNSAEQVWQVVRA